MISPVLKYPVVGVNPIWTTAWLKHHLLPCPLMFALEKWSHNGALGPQISMSFQTLCPTVLKRSECSFSPLLNFPSKWWYIHLGKERENYYRIHLMQCFRVHHLRDLTSPSVSRFCIWELAQDYIRNYDFTRLTALSFLIIYPWL